MPPNEINSNSQACNLFDIKNVIYLTILSPWQTRTHCCGHIVADTNVSQFAPACNICCGHKFCVRDTKNVSGFGQKQFVSATNVSQFAQPKKHQGKQCVLVYQGLKTLFTLCCRNLKTAFFTHFFRPHYSGEI